MLNLILTAAAGGAAGILTTILPFVVLIVVFYFLLIRPENKKKKALSEMRNALAVGDEVTTIGGIVGRVVHIKDDLVTIETSEDRVRIQITRWAISTKGTQTAENG
ncbi:MAG: preprotein translocase subunit YajC [Oscillospiraceae bacterium]|nr:preprotein translocase subunit YajC [Oscillospiraceae bacterium]